MVCISSISGEPVVQTNYAASKAAIIGLTKSLARETARYGVRNAVAPDSLETDMDWVISRPKCKSAFCLKFLSVLQGKPGKKLLGQ